MAYNCLIPYCILVIYSENLRVRHRVDAFSLCTYQVLFVCEFWSDLGHEILKSCPIVSIELIVARVVRAALV